VDAKGCTPLFYTPYSFIECFQSVFEAGIRNFPKKKGIRLLFLKSNNPVHVPRTAFEHACEKFGSENVMDVIEKTFTNYDNTPYNIVDILLSTASDENLSLDGVYFLLRREPDILQKMLSSSTTSTTKKNTNTALVTGPNHNTYKSKDSDKDNKNSSGVMISTVDSRKRKRE